MTVTVITACKNHVVNGRRQGNGLKIRMSRNEDKLLHLAMNSRQGLAFSELYAGHWEGKYSSQSEADMALCSMLAFWCGRDTAMMDKLFRRSGLMREKWDRQQSGSTYGALTLQKAAATCAQVYSPSSPKTDDDYRIEIAADGEATDDNGKIKTYSFDDMGNAQRMLDLFGQKILYNYNEKKWLIYDGIRWRTDGTGFIRTLADRALKQKLLGELEGIFVWAVEGVRLYNEQGLRMPAAVAAAVEEYRAEMDVISCFIAACCITQAGRQVKANDLYRVYSEWCSRNNEYCMSSTKFGTEVAKRFQKMHIRSGWIYCNICLNQEYAPYQMSIGKEA